MIDTSKLKDGYKVIVIFDNEETAKCRYSQGVFVNIEDSHHFGEIYGSSVAHFRKLRK